MNKSINKRSIVVLGMHRSGTSAFTGALGITGLHTGNTLLPANEFNAKGYFESAPLVREHNVLLDALEHAWYDERPLPVDWHTLQEARKAKQRLIEVYCAEFKGTGTSVIKDPRMCRLLPIWKEIFEELEIKPNYILMLRQPEEVASSLRQRDGMAANKAILLYLAYLLDAEHHTRGQPRIVVDFPSLLRDWRGVLSRLETGLGLNLLPVTEEVAQRITDFLSPALKHFNLAPNQSAEPIDEPMRLATELYRTLTAGQLDEKTECTLDEIRNLFERYRASLEPWLSEAARVHRLERELLCPGKRLEEAAGREAQSVLYWEDGSGFAETRTIKLPWHFGQDRQILRFVFPDNVKNIFKLRWDMTDRPASCEVFRLWVENPQGEQLWQWQQGMSLFAACSTDVQLIPQDDSGSLYLVATGFDPHGLLEISLDVIMRLTGGWAVVVEFSAKLSVMAIPVVSQSLTQQTNRLIATLAELQKYKQNTEEIQGQLTDRGKEIARLLEQQDQCRVNLLRAEAQIELLKSLYLTGDHFERI